MNTTETCGCGMPYTDTAAGRHTHRVLYGHGPSRKAAS